MKFCFFIKSLILGFIALGLSSNANAQSTFVFNFATDNTDVALAELNGSTFTSTASDSSTLDLLVLASQAAEFDTTVDPPVATGSDVGAMFLTAADGLVIDNPTLTDEQSLAANETTGEDGFINGGETFTFEFGTDVTFNEIDFFGVGTNSNNGIAEVVQVLIEGNETPFNFASNSDSDTFTDPFGSDATIAAGTDITFTSSQISDSFAIGDFTVTDLGTTTIPEPSSSSLLALALTGVAMVRRRSA